MHVFQRGRKKALCCFEIGEAARREHTRSQRLNAGDRLPDRPLPEHRALGAAIELPAFELVLRENSRSSECFFIAVRFGIHAI